MRIRVASANKRSVVVDGTDPSSPLGRPFFNRAGRRFQATDSSGRVCKIGIEFVQHRSAVITFASLRTGSS